MGEDPRTYPPRDDSRPYPRMVLDEQDPLANAHAFRHELKNRLNALTARAQLLLLQHREGHIGLRKEAVEFLQSVPRVVADAVPLINLVRELPAQASVEAPRDNAVV